MGWGCDCQKTLTVSLLSDLFSKHELNSSLDSNASTAWRLEVQAHQINVNSSQNPCLLYLFIYLGFYVAFNTVQVISRRVVGRAEETSTYSSLGFCTVNCRPTASNYQLSHLRPCWGSKPGLRGGRRECYHSATVAPRVCCK